jgi:hypothetical protein
VVGPGSCGLTPSLRFRRSDTTWSETRSKERSHEEAELRRGARRRTARACRAPDMTYEYRPLLDGVAVRVTSARPSFPGSSHHVPARGWLHQRDCPCSYCQVTEETLW